MYDQEPLTESAIRRPLSRQRRKRREEERRPPDGRYFAALYALYMRAKGLTAAEIAAAVSDRYPDLTGELAPIRRQTSPDESNSGA